MITVLRPIIFLISILGFCRVWAQPSIPEPLADSLWAVWSNSEEGTEERLKALYNYAWDGYLHSNPDSAIYFSSLQLQLADHSENKEYKAKAYNLQGTAYKIKGDYVNAEQVYGLSIKILEETGDTKNLRKAYNNLGNLLYYQGNYPKAIDYFSQCLKYARESNDIKSEALTINNLSSVYYTMKEYDKALSYYENSLDLSLQAKDSAGIANVYNNMALVFMKKNELLKSRHLFEKSIGIRKRNNLISGLAASYNNMANLLKKTDRIEAIQNYTKSLEIYKEINDQQGIASAYENIGLVYFEDGNYGRSIEYSKKALELGEESGIIHLISSSAKTLYQAYKASGQKDKALKMHELHIAMRDSLEKIENTKALVIRELNEEYEKKKIADSIRALEVAEIQKAKYMAQKAKARQQELENEQLEIKSDFDQTINIILIVGLSLLLLVSILLFNRFRTANKQKVIIEEQKKVTDYAYKRLEEKNAEIVDSISYAKRIQNAILPSHSELKSLLPNAFVLYLPKDIVAGDFYWIKELKKSNKILFAVADCTGHGVPGAMVSVICNNALNRAVNEYELKQPADILNKSRDLVVMEFEKSKEEMKDGMDIALCSIAYNDGGAELIYSGANNPVWILRKGADTFEEFKANKAPIGKYVSKGEFSEHTIELSKGDHVFIFSDGYPDQFGGQKKKGEKFKSKRLRNTLIETTKMDKSERRNYLKSTFESWKGSHEQVDDVCLIGLEI